MKQILGRGEEGFLLICERPQKALSGISKDFFQNSFFKEYNKTWRLKKVE